MLDNLNIINGVISPSFTPLNNTYTISVSSDIYSLIIDYDVSSEYKVEIINNENFNIGENNVVIQLTDELGNAFNYNLLVNKSKEVSAFNEGLNATMLEVSSNTDEIPEYSILGLIIIVLSILLFMFKILFLKKKKR